MENDIKVNVMFCEKHFDRKPNGAEIAKLQKQFRKTTISIKDLAYSMSSGCTFKPAYMNGTKNEDFISQQVFAIDFDHGTTIESELNKCKSLGIMPIFGYTTFSHTPESNRFRLVFLNNEVIYDIKKRRKLQYSLMKAFGFCDPACKDETRMFFGGKSLILLEEDNVIDGNRIIEKYYIDESPPVSAKKNNQQKSIKVKSTKTIKNTDMTEIEQKVKAISELNVEEMKRLLNPVEEHYKIDTEEKSISHNIVAELKIKNTQPITPNIASKITAEINKKIANNSINIGFNSSQIKSIQHKVKANLKIKDNSNDEYIEIEDEIENNKTELSANEIIIVIILISIFATVIHRSLKSLKGDLGGGDKKESYSITPYKNPTPSDNCKHQSDDNDFTPEKHIFKCRKDLYDYITNEIDLTEYLGIGDKKVCCILPEHEDNTPSAHVYTNENGMQFYKCFGCGKARNIIGITEHLSGCKRSEAIEFIKSVYDLELVESEWTQQQKQLMIECANYLDTDEFKDEFPDLYKLIRTRKSHIKLMLLHFSEMVNEDMQIDGKPFFFSSYPKLMEVCNIKKSDKLAQSLALFALLHMIEKLPEDKIPQDDYRKAKAIAAKYGLKKVTGFYAFEEYGINTFNDSEEKAIRLKENNISLKGVSREWVYRTFGEDEANRVYPQYKYENSKGTSEKSDIHTAEIVKCIMYCIEKKGYATERDVVAILGKKYNYMTTEVQIKKSLQEILNTYSLCRVRANKEYKEKYNILGNGYPFIIIRDNSN